VEECHQNEKSTPEPGPQTDSKRACVSTNEYVI